MKSPSFRRVLAAVFLLVVLGGMGVVWLVGSEYGRRVVAQKVRQALTHDSELVLEPFTVEFSPWRDFPHLTASLQHIGLTDTSFRRRMPVLRIARADLRLELLPLLRGRVLVKRLAVTDVDFRERVDSLGHSWGLRGKRKRGTGKAPGINLTLDELLVTNFQFSSQNGYLRTAFGARADVARLSVRLKGGVMHVAGTLDGQLSYLRTRAGTLFEREPVQAWVHYKYTFKNRQGLLYRTRATLNGDTIRVSGTNTVDPDQPAGTLMNLRFVGNQPLPDVLHAALPPRLEPYLAGATSPSKAHIHYSITGISGPKVTPHNVLTFNLRAASLKWPGQGRHITRWDLAGTYDNGPRHNIRSTILTLKRCRIYSAAGRLDAALTLRDFKRPFVNGRVRGRTELPELAAIVSPGRWQARAGVADLDVRMRGLLPPPANRPDLGPRKNISLHGTVNLHQASFLLPLRGADLSALDVKVGLQDSLWQLSNASGVLNGMRFKASATTVHLLDYLTGQHATASISGRFQVDELRVASLRTLLRPLPRNAGPGFAPTSLPKRARNARDRAQLAATLGSELIPAGLRLNVDLQCQRLLLATDTLNDLAVSVRHDGQQVQLLNLAGRVWGGDVRGNVHWPTDPDNRVAPVAYDLSVHFANLNYRQFAARFARPAPNVARPAKRRDRPASPASPALRDLLLAANGRLTLDIDHAQLPEDESMRHVSLQLIKTGSLLRLPYLRFRTPEGGYGEAQATAEVEDFHLVAADADMTLRYATLDVTRLLGLISSLTTPTDTVPTARSLARIERKATRRSQRMNTPGNHSLLSNGVLSAVLRVEADEVHYGPLQGSKFRLVSHLLEGEAKLDNCSVDVLQGHIQLSGYMRSSANRAHHPTQLQMRLQDVELPALFAGATGMGLNVLSGENIRGSLRGVADIRTDLGKKFLPDFAKTDGFLKVDFRNLELINVEVLMEALKFMKAERTSHLYFAPVAGEFLFTQGQLIIPGLRLDSNLSNLEISGHYGLDGATNLFIGLKPLQALFGNNDKRIERIQNGEPVSQSDNGKLTYVNLRRTAPKEKYKVRLFQRDEQREAMARLRQQYRDYLITQRLDTTVRLLR
ncbi:AsmA-like C-terminal region-containing protein [Hymenobacter convexus]|uniref:AsmA-like C-terminal region-containing protein n=1 Tax=Hymenobacter sp. CA1UV-4 TaxID=3063782 RepID=UPI002712A600|nr:AsmA-like C-terminal region-containing protein [Hymenobacter sp. CA1UV-4]MDO7851324.1 AsmA-like C-terminal region-containing protein [Hymenobacter sp. CA1UV-4]